MNALLRMTLTILLASLAAGCSSPSASPVVVNSPQLEASASPMPLATATPAPSATALPPSESPLPSATPLPTLSGSGGGVLALARQEGEQRDIYLVNADGSGQHQITRSNQVDEQCPRWKP